MAIVESRADVIFLCDTRVISSQGISCELRIKNFLRDNKIRKYQAYLNSASNSRGTAILIANDLEYTIIREYRDPGENYHIAHVLINGTEYGIGAIYGPNHTSRDFYRNIDAVLGDLLANDVTNTVLGGDWNTTWDRRPVISNIDTFQMSGLPNPKNSEFLYNICTKHKLTDPFRTLYPIRKEFTYSPFGHVRLNRSRLDFFVVSETLIPNIGDCLISSSARCKLFDHKQVSLLLNPSLRVSKPKSSLSNSFLNDILLRASVELEARRLHIFSLDLENNIHIQDHGPIQMIKETELEKIRLCRNTINAVIKIRESISSGTYNRLQDLDLQGRERDIELQLAEMIPLNALEKIAKRCSSTEFSNYW
jgi:exonuclease III